MTWREPDIVPPGNAVLREHHDGVLTAERSRIARCVHLRLELAISNPQRQGVGFHGIQMRAPHHAGNLMSCQCEPHRKMAADGASTENANSHGWKSCWEGRALLVFTSLGLAQLVRRTGRVAAGAAWVARGTSPLSRRSSACRQACSSAMIGRAMSKFGLGIAVIVFATALSMADFAIARGGGG